jgi:transcriptional regulator with XRE-family HTH domain
VDEVKRLRLEKRWSQNELAYHAKLAPSVISLIETGKRDPNATTLRKLAEALEVRIPHLFEIPINYDACRTALESFCDHWQPTLSGERRLDRQGFQDFKADAASLSRLTRELMGAEMTTLGQQYDEEGDPMFYTERSEFGPAVMRFHDLAIRMDQIGKESFDEDLTSDPEMGQLLDLFPKAS